MSNELIEQIRGAYFLSLCNSGLSGGNIQHFYNLFEKHLKLLQREPSAVGAVSGESDMKESE